MAFFPVVPSTDDRRGKAITPLVLRNARIEPVTDPASDAPYVITDTPGKIARVSMPGLIRGVYRREGVRSGALFVVAGSRLYRITQTAAAVTITWDDGATLTWDDGVTMTFEGDESSWTATDLGAIAGQDRVIMDEIAGNLLILGGGVLHWLGQSSTLLHADSTVLLTEDGDQLIAQGDNPTETLQTVPINLSGATAASTLAVLANRVCTNSEGADLWDWSAPGEPFWWPDGAFAQSAREPDPIIAQATLSGDLWHMGASTIQIWRATGGVDEEAFDTFGNVVLDVGLVGRFAWTKVGASLAFVGVDANGALGLYTAAQLSARIVPNRELEAALAKLTVAQRAQIEVCAWADGSNQYVAVRLPNANRAFVYDATNTTWAEDLTWDATAWRGGMTASAFGVTVWASASSRVLYSLDDDTHTDAGAVLERVITVRAPLAQQTTIYSLVIDMAARGQPLAGAGAEPLIEVTYSRDGGRTTSDLIGDVRTVRLPAQGEYRRRIKVTRLGSFDVRHGLWLRFRITDPVGFAIRGVRINEDAR